MTNKSIREYINLIENAQREGVAEGSTTPKVTFAQSTPGSWARIDILVNGVKQFVAAKTIGPGFWSIFDLEDENIGSGSNKSEIKSAVLDYLSKQGVAEGYEEDETDPVVGSRSQWKRRPQPQKKKEQGVAEGYDDEEHPIRDDGNEGRPGKQRYPGKLPNKGKGVAEAGNKPIDRQFPLGTGDTRSPRDIKSQMRGASDRFVQQTAASKPGPFRSKVAKMQNKMANSELRKRSDHDRMATGTNEGQELSEEMIADRLKSELALFKKGAKAKDKDLGSKPKSKEVQPKKPAKKDNE